MSQRDYLDEDGATALARRIDRFWQDRGLCVHTRLIEIARAEAGDGKCRLYGIRSDMVAGYPRPVKA